MSIDNISYNLGTSSDDFCSSLTISSTGWSKDYLGRFGLWGDYGRSKKDINEKNAYEHTCTEYNRFLHWVLGGWVVSKLKN